MDDEELPIETPPPEVTKRLFRKWKATRRGQRPAEDLTNPVWLWLFRGRIDPSVAEAHFKKRIVFPNTPRWAGCRLGQSHTKLSDGREIWIAGEHEDYYDPDFFIYNDVIIEHSDRSVQILGYPVSAFRPTDFHSATAIENESAVLLIGNIGYADDRRIGETQVYRVDTRDFQICEVVTHGELPGWIHSHRARLSEDHLRIEVSGGAVLSEDGFIENIDEWSLELSNFKWTRLTRHNWPRFRVQRSDDESLHLWEYGMLDFHRQHPVLDSDPAIELAAELGMEPNLEVYKTLWRPSVDHEFIEQDPEEEDDNSWRTRQIVIDGVRVRFVEDMDNVMVTIEGNLSTSKIDSVLDEFTAKLSRVENSPCVAKPIGG